MNRWLSRASLKVIEAVQADEDQEITWEKGAGYWVGDDKVSTAGCEHLIRLCLLRQVYGGHVSGRSDYIVYTLSSEVDRVLADEKYTPAIVTAQLTGQPQFIEGKTKRKKTA